MWNSLEKAAKKANAAAKKVVTDNNEQFQSVAEKVKDKTRVITENQHVKKVTTKVKATTKHIVESEPVQVLHETCFDPLAKKVAKEAGNFHQRITKKDSNHGNDNDNNNQKIRNSRKASRRLKGAKISVNAHGDGDMSEITWSDGSIRSMPSLRVFGKDTTIVVASDLNHLITDNSTNSITNSITNSKTIKEEGDGDGDGDGDGSSEDNNTNNENRRLSVHQSSSSAEHQQSDHPVHENTNANKVNLPVLIFPGIASSGLYVENSGLDNDRYKGRRLWMNAGFLAMSALDNKMVAKAVNEDAKNDNPYIDHNDAGNGSGGGSAMSGNIQDCDYINRNNMTTSNVNNNNSSRPYVEQTERSVDEVDVDVGVDVDPGIDFAKTEEELHIRSAWLYHVSLDKNMVDERPGNRVRTYDGIKSCEWLVDDAIGKTQAGVWADAIRFLEDKMGYVRGKNIDAAPYDWRLPPFSTEARDGYLTKTMKQVETMYEENDGLPVVLCCHSMGCKMGHYFLNFCLKEKGREWIDRHIHTYMPIGAPHCGGHLTVKLGVTGAGLVGLIDDIMLSLDEGLIMYRSWGSGPWLMPREIPPGVFPPCIVRREGELGIKINSEIDVGPLFADREKPPKELRLTIIFREKIHASTDFVPLKMDGTTDPASMILAFDETFYLAVPYLEDNEDLGNLVFYLEEPSGRLYQNDQPRIRQQFQNATKWARSFKKEVTKIYRSVAKKIGSALRVAVCERPLQLKSSAFEKSSSTTIDGSSVIESVVPFCKCKGGSDAKKILNEYNDASENQEEEDEDFSSLNRSLVSLSTCGDQQQAIGSLSLLLSYSPPPDFSKEPSCTTKFAIIPKDTPSPPVVSRRRNYNTVHHEKIVYDAWNGSDLLEKDGFCQNMFDVYEEYYEQDPLGPTTVSALEAPPVSCVRAIYGINVPTEISAVYRKEPVVTIGDSIADCRYMIDKSAAFPKRDGSKGEDERQITDPRIEAMMEGYHIKDGIINETPRTLQNVPGTTEQRRCCGDGTVPYWSLVHCLNWKDSIPEVTADELEGAVHRPILSDKRFLALLQQHCTVNDPRLPSGGNTTISTAITTT